jgi:hypothetical protein
MDGAVRRAVYEFAEEYSIEKVYRTVNDGYLSSWYFFKMC